MYRAMDRLYEEEKNPSDVLELFLSDLNPYIWADRTTADPAVQADFNASMDRENIGAEVDEERAYYAVKNFLAEQYPHFVEWAASSEKSPSFVDLFEKISLDEWKKICALITEEEETQKLK